MVRVPWCTPPLGVPSAADLIREGIVVNLIRRERAAMPAELERRCLVAELVILGPQLRSAPGQRSQSPWSSWAGTPRALVPAQFDRGPLEYGLSLKELLFLCNHEV